MDLYKYGCILTKLFSLDAKTDVRIKRSED